MERQVADPTDPGDRLVALLAQPSEDEAAKGLTTSIPADTTLRAMPVLNEETGELVIDLSSEFLSIEGPELPKAFAQIVWTVTELARRASRCASSSTARRSGPRTPTGRSRTAPSDGRTTTPSPRRVSYSKNTWATS